MLRIVHGKKTPYFGVVFFGKKTNKPKDEQTQIVGFLR